MPGVRLHVLHGRDASNCTEWEVVEAAQKSGYSPGATVCLKCPYYPKLAALPPCEYYKSRMRAARDYNRARATGTPYPIILSTHGSMVQAQHLTQHEYGTFWSMDTIFFDEDPSAALESPYTVGLDQLVYKHPTDIHSWMTTLLREAIHEAASERDKAAARHFKRQDGSDDPIHTRHGSAYVSEDLHMLLERTMSRVALAPLTAMGIQDARTLIVQTINSSSTSGPDAGEFAAMTPQAIAANYPHHALEPIATALDNEIMLLKEDRQNGMFNRFGYLARLECRAVSDDDDDEEVSTLAQDEWTYTCSEFRVYGLEDPNIIIGDAYAHVAHYEAIFARTADVIDHRAKWPADTLLLRYLAPAGRRAVGANPTRHFEDHIRPILYTERERRVLFYVHKRFKTKLMNWLIANWNDFGLANYAIEHYASGRGKDIYRDFDTFIAVSEFIPNTMGLLHEANGRAFLQQHYTDRFRVEHWQQGTQSARKGSQRFGQSMTNMDPRLLPIYQRRCVEELAQAVHRIRPSMPSRSDHPSKRVWIVGHNVPLTDELLAATTTMSFDVAHQPQDGKPGASVAYSVEPGADLERGKLINLHEGPSALISPREMAAAIGVVYAQFGCWSSAFAHALYAITSDSDFSMLQPMLREDNYVTVDVPHYGTVTPGGGNVHYSKETLYRAMDISTAHCHGSPGPLPGPLCDRVWSPPAGWESLSERMAQTRQYRTALDLFEQAVEGGPLRGRLRRPWMLSGSRGRDYIGDPQKFLAIIDQYAPPKIAREVAVPF
jgi:hypothetical protein